MPDDDPQAPRVIFPESSEELARIVDRMILNRTIEGLEVNCERYTVTLMLSGGFELEFQIDPEAPPYVIRAYEELKPEGKVN